MASRNTRAEVLRALKMCALFSGLPDGDARLFAREAKMLKLSRGESLFEEGQRADGFYVVESGRVKVYKSSPDGREQILHLIDSGGTFGEAAVFYGGTYPASAQALKPSRVVYVDGGAFLELIEGNPLLAVEIMASLSARLRAFTRLIEALSLKEVSARLAKYLLDEAARANSDSVELPGTKAALAASLGTVAETLSRAFAALSRRKLVKVSGRVIHISDHSGLERASAGLT